MANATTVQLISGLHIQAHTCRLHHPVRDGRSEKGGVNESLKILLDENKTYIPNSVRYTSSDRQDGTGQLVTSSVPYEWLRKARRKVEAKIN